MQAHQHAHQHAHQAAMSELQKKRARVEEDTHSESGAQAQAPRTLLTYQRMTMRSKPDLAVKCDTVVFLANAAVVAEFSGVIHTAIHEAVVDSFLDHGGARLPMVDITALRLPTEAVAKVLAWMYRNTDITRVQMRNVLTVIDALQVPLMRNWMMELVTQTMRMASQQLNAAGFASSPECLTIFDKYHVFAELLDIQAFLRLDNTLEYKTTAHYLRRHFMRMSAALPEGETRTRVDALLATKPLLRKVLFFTLDEAVV